MKINNQTTTIVSINNLNKYFEVKIADFPTDSFHILYAISVAVLRSFSLVFRPQRYRSGTPR